MSPGPGKGLWEQLNGGNVSVYDPQAFSLDTLNQALQQVFPHKKKTRRKEKRKKVRSSGYALTSYRMVIMDLSAPPVHVKDPTRILKLQPKP